MQTSLATAVPSPRAPGQPPRPRSQYSLQFLGPWAAAQASLLSKIACLQIRRIKKLRSSQLRHASSRRYQARDKLGRNLTSQRSASASSPPRPPPGALPPLRALSLRAPLASPLPCRVLSPSFSPPWGAAAPPGPAGAAVGRLFPSFLLPR